MHRAWVEMCSLGVCLTIALHPASAAYPDTTSRPASGPAMPTLGQIYDSVARSLANGRSVGEVIDRATARYGQEWAETVRELTRRAVAAFAAGSALTYAPPGKRVNPEDIPYTLGTDRRLRYLVQYWHNPGEMQWFELYRDLPFTNDEIVKRALELAKTVKPDQDTGPADDGDDTVFPPSPAEMDPNTVFVVVTRAERLYPIREPTLERGQAVPLPKQ